MNEVLHYMFDKLKNIEEVNEVMLKTLRKQKKSSKITVILVGFTALKTFNDLAVHKYLKREIDDHTLLIENLNNSVYELKKEIKELKKAKGE